MQRLEMIEVVVTTSTRRVWKAFDTQLRQVVSVTSEVLGTRDGPSLLAELDPYVHLPRTRTVAPLLDVFLEDDRIVLVSPWVEGVDLLALLVASGTPGLPVTAVLSWLDQVGEAVRHLQASGLVHGNLRPANLVLSGEQQVVVLGLGTGVLDATVGATPEHNDVRDLAATAAALLTGTSPSVGAITGTSTVSATALRRALLPVLDSNAGDPPSLDDLLANLRHELNAVLPTGVVTFLLTDIVGSTARWEADATKMAVQLAHHDLLMAEAVEAAGGRLLKARGEGDATFSVFTRATEAVTAAIEAQRRLRAETELVMRVAIHTGEAELRGADYFGRIVNRAARLRSVAPDGGVLLSSASADLVADHLPAGVELRDLGERVLKDLDRAEHTYQLVGTDLGDVQAVDLPQATTRLAQLPRVVDDATVAGPARPPMAPSGTPVPPRAPAAGRPKGRIALVAAVAAVAVAGIVGTALVLGGGGDTEPTATAQDRTTTTTTSATAPSVPSTTATSAPSAATPPVDRSGLGARLLELEDLGPRFTRIQDLEYGDGAEPCGQPSVDIQLPPQERAGFLAQNVDGTASVTEGLRQYADADEAESGFRRAKAAVACSTATVFTEEGEPAEGAIGPLQETVITGDRPAFVTDITLGQYVVTIAVAQVDDIVVIVQAGLFVEQASAARGATVELLERAAARVSPP